MNKNDAMAGWNAGQRMTGKGGLVLVAVALLLAFTVVAQAQQVGQGRYRLVFSDEFNGPDGSQPDATKWRRCGRATSTWNRLMSKEDHRVVEQRGGTLRLRAIPNNDLKADTSRMLTGGIESIHKYSFQYGLVEARIKTKLHQGNFPAFWLMPQPPCEYHPKGGEIDIFETVNTQQIAYQTVHTYWTNVVGINRQTQPKTANKKVNVSRWHVYGLEWTPTELVFFIDGEKTFTYRKSTDAEQLKNGQWPFDHPFYIILNQALGSWNQPYDLKYTYETQVDWVRVYQRGD